MEPSAGVSLFNLSRRMGTSVGMIDATYGQLAPDAEEHERALLDAYDAREQVAETSARSRLSVPNQCPNAPKWAHGAMRCLGS